MRAQLLANVFTIPRDDAPRAAEAHALGCRALIQAIVIAYIRSCNVFCSRHNNNWDGC